MLIIKKIKRKMKVYYTKICFGSHFGKIGKNTYLGKPIQIDNPTGIIIGNCVAVGKDSWFYLNDKESILDIGDNTSIGHFFHVVVKEKVEIQKSVLIADRVFISDCTHSYIDVSIPIKEQEVVALNSVHIGEGSWIGENVCIIGVDIGKHSVVGSNSVVTNSIPDYSIAVGCPAKVIKRYDHSLKEWVKINEGANI